MDLIIKPTMSCNFKCTFCSSSNISIESSKQLDNTLLYDFINQNDIQTIVVNGGDPLMMSPKYYWDLINHIELNHLSTNISLTTNLWDFYKNPNKWMELFKHPKIGVCTSFQYGNERRLGSGEVFTESMFKEIFFMFKELIGYEIMFIAVINDSNENTTIETVELARSLNTECKMNPVVKSGRSGYYYPFYKIMQKYIEIIEHGLSPWEFNSKEIKKLIHNQPACCPYGRTCYKNIRAISPEGLIHSCGSINDDHYVNLKLNKPTYELSSYNERKFASDYNYIKKECFGCDMFDFCNSCYKRIMDIKENPNEINTHCLEMKKLEKKLMRVLS